MTDQTKIIMNAEIPFTDLGGGVKRKVLSYNNQMMIVEVHFQKDSIGSAHTHKHTQSTYVKKGKFIFTIDNKDFEVCEGDTITFESNILHGTKCIEEGVLIDIFTPLREDFLS